MTEDTRNGTRAGARQAQNTTSGPHAFVITSYLLSFLLGLYSCGHVQEGALLEAILKWDRARAGRAGVTRIGRCGARGCVSQTQTRGALGNRPGPITGLCLEWLDGAGARGRKPSGSWRKPLLVPEVRSQGRRSRRWWSAGRRCRVPLFPGDPGDTPRRVTVRLSALRFPSPRGEAN